MDGSESGTISDAEATVPDTPSTPSIHNLPVIKRNKDLDDTENEDETQQEHDIEFEEDQANDAGGDCFPDNMEAVDYVEKPELIVLPFMNDSFEWRNLMPKSFYKRKHSKKPTKVGPDLVDSGTAVEVADSRRRCRYTGKNPNEAQNIIDAHDFIDDLLKKIRINVQVIICKFFMTIATYLKFGISKTSGVVDNYDDFVEAIESVDNDEDGKKVTIIAYIVFDFMLHWQHKVSEIVCERLNFRVVDKENKLTKSGRKPKDFVYKMCSYILNTERRNINTFSKNSIGQIYTIMRWGIHLARKKNKHDDRKKKNFYKWMIMIGDVSESSQ